MDGLLKVTPEELEKTADLFSADSVVTIVNTESKTTSTYTAKEVTKEIYTYENIIALNLGTEIEFINTGGWLVKRYKATQEITNITLSSSIAGIIYRDRIEIIIGIINIFWIQKRFSRIRNRFMCGNYSYSGGFNFI